MAAAEGVTVDAAGSGIVPSKYPLCSLYFCCKGDHHSEAIPVFSDQLVIFRKDGQPF